MSATQQLLRFGVFELNLATEELRKGGTNLKLPPQPFRLLVLLVSRAGQVVTREEIKKQLGVDRMQRNFEPMRKQVEDWRAQQMSAAEAKLTIYRAFIEGDLDVPRHLARRVHDLYFNPQHEEFNSRTMWSLSNAFTSSFKELDPIPQFRATAKLAGFLQPVRPS